MEQTRDLFCIHASGVARCQSQHQYHYWRKSSMFEAYSTGNERSQKSKDSLKACFKNVNICKLTGVAYVDSNEHRD